MAKLVDALASGASYRKVVEVQVLSWAPNKQWPLMGPFLFLPGEKCYQGLTYNLVQVLSWAPIRSFSRQKTNTLLLHVAGLSLSLLSSIFARSQDGSFAMTA